MPPKFLAANFGKTEPPPIVRQGVQSDVDAEPSYLRRYVTMAPPRPTSAPGSVARPPPVVVSVKKEEPAPFVKKEAKDEDNADGYDPDGPRMMVPVEIEASVASGKPQGETEWGFLTCGEDERARARAVTAKVLGAASEGLALFQIPPKAWGTTVPRGKVGKMRVHKSGRVVLVIGPHEYEVQGSMPVTSQRVVAIVPATEMCVDLGGVETKWVCVPASK